MVRIIVLLLCVVMFSHNAEADIVDACKQLEAAQKHLKDRVPYSELQNRDQSALIMFEKAAQESCSDEKCNMCQIHARVQVAKLHEKYNRDKEAFENYLQVAEGYLKEPLRSFRLSSGIKRRLASYYAEGKVTEQNYEKAYYWLTLGKGKNVKVSGRMPNRKTLVKDFKIEVLAHLSEEQIKKIDEQNKKYLEKVAQQQRNNFANLMDQMTIGFNPKASPHQKAYGRLAFELGINKFHYDLTGIKKLIEMGALKATPTRSSFLGQQITSPSLLFQAQELNDLALLKLLIENGADLNITDHRGSTVLHRAIGHGHTDLAIELINAGADLSIVNKDLKNTPLMAAASKGNLKIVKALVDAGADVNQIGSENGYNKNALEEALHFGYYKVANYLKSKGAQIVTKYRNYPDPIPQNDTKCPMDKKTCSNNSTVRRDRKTCEFLKCPEPKQYEPVEKVAGTFSEIDTELSSKAVFTLKNGNKEEKERVIGEIEANPGNYNPAALKALSIVLFSRIEDEDAAFWYIAADLRNREDNLVCETSEAAWRKMSFDYSVQQFKPYAQLNPDIVKSLLDKVLEWDKATPYNYDVRWVTLGNGRHGHKQTDFIPDKLCAPKNKWDKAREFSRNEYASVFKGYTKAYDYRADPAPKLKSFYLSKEEFKAILDKAKTGDAEAQYKIATVALTHAHKEFLDGDSKAFRVKWLQEAAKQGHVGAITKVGQQYLSGYKIPEEQRAEKFEEGKKMLIEAGLEGSFTAFNSIGGYYLGKNDPIEGYAWFALEEHVLLKKQPELKTFPSKRRKMKLEATMPEEDLEKAKIRAQEYIRKYASK